MDLTHWKLTVDADHLAWLYFDRAGTATNTFSSEALRELGRIADHLASMPPKGLAILSAKDSGFAAGADIDEFTRIASAEEALAFMRLGNEVFDKVAALPFPTLALIHGFCMGGALELALACRYRVADDGPKTRMALPEVMIGITPGWGGARRLPALIGAAAALDLMLTGRGVDARRAKKLGLVDAVTPRRHFENAARQILTAPPAPHRPGLAAAITDWPGMRSFVAAQAEKKVAERARRDQYPAPYAIIATWKDFGGDPRNIPERQSRLDREPLRPSDHEEPDQDLQAAGAVEGVREGGSLSLGRGPGRGSRSSHPRHRRRRHGRRHRGVGGAEGRHGDAAGPGARAHRARGEARGGALRQALEAAAPGAGGAWTG